MFGLSKCSLNIASFKPIFPENSVKQEVCPVAISLEKYDATAQSVLMDTNDMSEQKQLDSSQDVKQETIGRWVNYICKFKKVLFLNKKELIWIIKCNLRFCVQYQWHDTQRQIWST